MEYEKLNNQEIVEKLKLLQMKYDEVKGSMSELDKQMNVLGNILLEIKGEFERGEEILKKRLNIK